MIESRVMEPSTQAAKSNMDFAAVYREHYPQVIRLAQVMTGDTDTAKDVAQDVFIAVLRCLEDFRGDSTMRTWIYRITLRMCSRHIARRRRYTGAEVDPDTFPAVGTAESAAAIAELLNALSKLSVASRTILSLVAIEGLSNEAAAEVLGIPVGTAWSRLHAARQQLASVLGK